MAWKPDYVSAADAASYLRISDALDNTELAMWATAASRAIDSRCNRQFGQEAAPVLRRYRRTPAYDPTTGLWILEIDDVQTATGMIISGTAYAAAGVTLLPDNAAADGRPWTALGFPYPPTPSAPAAPSYVDITARWGWTAVPAQVVAACKLQLSRWHARRDSPYGIAGSAGAEVRLLARLDPDVSTSLAGLSRRRAVG